MRDLEAAVHPKPMLVRLLPNYTSFLILLSCQMFPSFELLAKVCEDFRPVPTSSAKSPHVLGANDLDIRTEQNKKD